MNICRDCKYVQTANVMIRSVGEENTFKREWYCTHPAAASRDPVTGNTLLRICRERNGDGTCGDFEKRKEEPSHARTAEQQLDQH